MHADPIEIDPLRHGQIERLRAIDVRGEDVDLMPPLHEPPTQPMHRHDRTAVSPRRGVSGDDVEDAHGGSTVQRAGESVNDDVRYRPPMRWYSKLLRLPLRLVPGGHVVRIVSGPIRGMRWITGSATHGCWLGIYEKDTQRVFLNHVHPGDVVLDIGANVGFFTLLASKLVGSEGKVYAFEPLPRNMSILRAHLQANRLVNVETLPIAAAAIEGTAPFSTGVGHSMGHISRNGDLSVPTASLDHLLTSSQIATAQFIKIDVEGAEFGVLTGGENLIVQSHPVILLSTHGYREHERCTEWLTVRGYALETVRDGVADGQYTVLAIPFSRRKRDAARSRRDSVENDVCE